jgi:hypothetical protein
MKKITQFYGFSKKELRFFKKFKKPNDIQQYLNTVAYNPESITNSPRKIIHIQEANCFEGALFGACALRILGYKPLIIDLMAKNDDDHVIAIFKQDNCYGAVAKSNTKLLRYREPVYRTFRELIMSYFDFYFNILGEKSLVSYSNPVNLARFDKYNWMITDKDLGFIGDYLYKVQHHRVLSRGRINKLNPADKDIRDLCFNEALEKGLFIPVRKKSG